MLTKKCSVYIYIVHVTTLYHSPTKFNTGQLKLKTLTQFVEFILACSLDPVGISSSSTVPDQRFSASSSRSGSNPSYGRLVGSSVWIPGSNTNSNDYLQIDLGSVYFVCGVATQGNPNADDWTKTYKIGTSLDNVNWKMYAEDKVEKVHIHLCRLFLALE